MAAGSSVGIGNAKNDNIYEDDVPQDFEPGASKARMLVTIDSYDEIEEELESEANKKNERTRQISSTIVEIEETGRATYDEETDKTSEIDAADEQLQTLDISSKFEAEDHVEEVFSPDITDSPSSLSPDDIEDIQSPEWKQHKKHIFILSEAGKPIYSRYGSEDKLVTLMGVMQALVSFVQDNKDTLRTIIAGNHRFVFLVRGPIILVAVSQGAESVPQLVMQLTYLYNQILNLLTYNQLVSIFEKRHNYDLRRLLSGVEKFFDNMLYLMEHEPSFLLGSVRCLPLSSSMRDIISQSIVQSCSKIKNLVFAILIADNQLVTLVRMKKYFIHPMDLHILFNLVNASESLKSAESWMPICLPKFDSSGFLHGHVSYLEDDCPACLLLLTVDRDLFFTLSECKRKIVERLKKYHCLEAISESVQNFTYKISQVDIPDLRHFMYKSKSTVQYTSPALESPYLTKDEQERLFGLYLYLHQRIHSTSRPLKILFSVGEKETMLGWVTGGFELYATFEPLVTKFFAINAINKLLRWIKKEEDRLFILNCPVF